jgi:hypothetical protein
MNLACLRQRTLAESSVRGIYRTARLSAIALASFVAVVLLASLPARADVYWSTSLGDWSVASNWGGTPPGDSGTAYIVNGGTAMVTNTGNYNYNPLSLGGSTGSGTLLMSSSAFNVVTLYDGNSGQGDFMQMAGTFTAYCLSIGPSGQ